MLKIAAGIIGVAMLIAIASGFAHAHGDAAWIQLNPQYVTASGVHCCGPEHCRVAAPDEVRRVPGGWLHVPTMTSLMDGQIGVYASERDETFICVWGGAMKCYFPATGA